jgi:hypothetical protein
LEPLLDLEGVELAWTEDVLLAAASNRDGPVLPGLLLYWPQLESVASERVFKRWCLTKWQHEESNYGQLIREVAEKPWSDRSVIYELLTGRYELEEMREEKEDGMEDEGADEKVNSPDGGVEDGGATGEEDRERDNKEAQEKDEQKWLLSLRLGEELESILGRALLPLDDPFWDERPVAPPSPATSGCDAMDIDTQYPVGEEEITEEEAETTIAEHVQAPEDAAPCAVAEAENLLDDWGAFATVGKKEGKVKKTKKKKKKSSVDRDCLSEDLPGYADPPPNLADM